QTCALPIWMSRSERAHFLEEVQLDNLPTPLVNAGQTIGANTDVDACLSQLFQRKGRMFKVSMAARTMDDVDLAPGQQRRVLLSQIVDMYGKQARSQSAAAFQVLHRRTPTAISHVAF